MFQEAVECSRCGRTFPPHRLLTICENCGGALLFQYDLARVAEKISQNLLEKRKDTFWKFLELLPLSSRQGIVSLGEPYTPLLKLSKDLGLKSESVCVKDDGRLPTGTFKARGMAVAVSSLKEHGVKRVAMPSAGNAGAAVAVYGARAGMQAYVFMPKDVPETNLKECVGARARVYLVDGLIDDAAAIMKNLESKYRWFDMSTNKQPYRFEGYKAIAFEIGEQLGWKLPDNIFIPTGGGEGVIGLWKGFKELSELGWIDKTPRLIVVQASGCAPLVKAYEAKEPEVQSKWGSARTIAAGLRVPLPFASYLTLRAMRETKGRAVAVDDEAIRSSMKAFFRKGIYACPEAASSLAALTQLEKEGDISFGDRTILYLTGSVLKYMDTMAIERSKIPMVTKDTITLP